MRGSSTTTPWATSLVPAQSELSDSEIDTRYGALIRSAVAAFREDPSYIVEMAEAAAGMRHKRAVRRLAV